MKRKHPFVVGERYHVFNRGVAKCTICENESDFWRFLQGLVLFNEKNSTASVLWRLERDRGRLTMNVLKEYIVRPNNERNPLVRVLAYCIMGNHYHLILEEIQEGGITNFMRKLGVGYAKYFNNKYERVGSLFQNVFKNVLIESENQLLYLLVYVNILNPAEFIEPNWKENGVRDIEKVLKFAEKYTWSSHLDYLGKRGSLILDRGIVSELLPTPQDYMDLAKSVLYGKKYKEAEVIVQGSY